MYGTLIGLCVTIGSIFALDQSIKYKIEGQPPENFPKNWGNTSVTLHRTHNYGMMMNLLEKHPKTVSWLALGSTILFLLLHLPFVLTRRIILYTAGIALITGGSFSNVYDHFIRGYVVDYFSLPVRRIRHIIFNLADFAIFAGLFLCGLYYLFRFWPSTGSEIR